MNNREKRILVTGAAGLIGLHLCERLLKRGFDIVAKVLNIAKPNLDWNTKELNSASIRVPWRIYCIGNFKPVSLMSFIPLLENALDTIAEKTIYQCNLAMYVWPMQVWKI